MSVEAPRKPPAVLLLQIGGVFLLAISLIPLAIAAARGTDRLSAFAVVAAVVALAGVFALGAGWRRPAGIVVGMMALALLMMTLIGAIFVAIVAFLAARDRDRIRDFYASGVRS